MFDRWLCSNVQGKQVGLNLEYWCIISEKHLNLEGGSGLIRGRSELKLVFFKHAVQFHKRNLWQARNAVYVSLESVAVYYFWQSVNQLLACFDHL